MYMYKHTPLRVCGFASLQVANGAQWAPMPSADCNQQAPLHRGPLATL